MLPVLSGFSLTSIKLPVSFDYDNDGYDGGDDDDDDDDINNNDYG